MDFYILIKNRESVRNYDPDRPLSRTVLERILNAGRLAPSAANRQPWRFLLISSSEVLEKVRRCYMKDWFHDAPHILVVVGDETLAWTKRGSDYISLETDVTIAMDHMVLAAEYEGVGTCWIAAFNQEILRETLNLKVNEKVFTITPLGYPRSGFEKKGYKDRKGLEEVVKFL